MNDKEKVKELDSRLFFIELELSTIESKAIDDNLGLPIEYSELIKIDNYLDLYKEWNKLFLQLYESNYYFSLCNSKVYLDTYMDRLGEFQLKYCDSKEIDFLNYELEHIEIIENNRTMSNSSSPLDYYNKTKYNYSVKRKLEIINSKIIELTKVDEISATNLTETINTRFKSNISPTELVELVKALIESKVVNGTVKEIFEDFSKFFNVELKNPHKTFQDIKSRELGNETLFLDKLKSTLYDTIQK